MSYPDLSSAFGERFAMGFIGELIRNTRSSEKYATAIAGFDLALPYVSAKKRPILRAVMYALRTSPLLTRTLLRLTRSLRHPLRRQIDKL
jgi:hypothetical protein